MSTIIVIMQFFYLKSPKKLFKDYNMDIVSIFAMYEGCFI